MTIPNAQRGSGMLEFSLALALTASIGAGLFSVAGLLEQRRQAGQTLDLIHRASALARRQLPLQPDGYASLSTASIAGLVPANRVIWSGGEVAGLRTPLNRPLRALGNGPFAFWIRLSELTRQECRTLLPQTWRDYSRIKLNDAVVKSQTHASFPQPLLDQCAARGNVLDVEGS
ncbi:MAG: hypothetical protein IPK97_08205 [Ahniella sp.]|nr:hypothetical protein [Ahniella sp.]